MQPTTPQNTKPNQNVKHGLAEACKSGKPSELSCRIIQLKEIQVIRNEFMVKYKIKAAGFDVLLDVIYNWVVNHKSSTVWGLNNGRVGQVTAMHYKVRRLINKGLIEISGKGNRNCNVYVPTVKAMNEVIWTVV